VIRAVIFDFDGVLANSEPLHLRAYQEVLAENGLTLAEKDYYARYLGYDDVGAFSAIAADQGVALSADRVAAFVARKAERLEALEGHVSVLFPGAVEAVGRLAEWYPLAIASGALKAEILRVLERERLASFFAVVVAAEDTPSSKPAPDPYLCAVDRLRSATGAALACSECVAIEDSRWGLESARAAGLRTIAITHTYSADALSGSADTIIPGLDRLTCELLCRFDDSPNRHVGP
jgi:beta-phosphoglucomutase